MSVYRDTEAKLGAVRSVERRLRGEAGGRDLPTSTREILLGYADDLKAVLDTPVVEEDVPVPDMSVTVTWPADRGQMQGVTYGRESAPEADTLNALDRRIVRTLLEHALAQVPPEQISYPIYPVPARPWGTS